MSLNMIRKPFRTLLLAAALFVPFASKAQTFVPCQADSSKWTYLSADKQQEIKQQQDEEAGRCSAENAVLTQWTDRLQKINATREAMAAAANAHDWAAFRSKLSEEKSELLGLKGLADANSNVSGAAPVRSLFGENLGYLFKNVGMPAPASFDDAMAKIDNALSTPGQETNGATVALTMLTNASGRGNEFAVDLSRDAGQKYLAQQQAAIAARGAAYRDKEQGGSIDGYVTGFGVRVKGALAALCAVTLMVTILAGIIGQKMKRPKIVPKAAVLTFGVMILAGVIHILLPWALAWYSWLALIAAFGALWIYTEKLTILGGLFQTKQGSAPVGIGLAAAGVTVASVPATSAPVVSSAPNTHGSARWGQFPEMVEYGHIVDGKSVEALEPGLVLGRVGVNANNSYQFQIASHVLTCAPTGSGKGIGAVIPNLLQYPGSVFVLDIKGENYAVTARARRELGQKVYLVDPFGVTGAPTHGTNPLDRLDISNPDIVGDSAAIADMLVMTSKDEKGNHWNESAKELIRALIVYAVGQDDPTHRTLGEVRRLLTTDADSWVDTLADMAVFDGGFGVVSRAANALVSKPADERGSVISTAQRHTAFLDDPRIAATLARSDFSFDELKTGLVSVYLAMPQEKLESNARFVRALLGGAQSAIMANSRKPRYKVVFLLDEFAQLGYLPSVESNISLIRGYGGVFWLFVQDLSQLKAVYPKWQSFIANTAKHFFGTADHDTAKYISDSLGKGTIEYETGSTSKNAGSNFGGSGGGMNRGSSQSENQQFAGRELLTPDEVMRLGPTKPIVLISGESPYLLDRINYLDDRAYAGRADPNPYHIPAHA
jgi:type IV secretory pathway TraG/TraD family ATPase VirD4